jgi:hypothetical protein
MLLAMIGNGPMIIMSISAPKMLKAKDSATILYHIIDNTPDVDVREEGIACDAATFKGDIKFEGINFNYPTRPDLKIL